MRAELSVGEAAAALGVSVDTLRRWDRKGQIDTTRDARNRRLVPAAEIERLSERPARHRTGTDRSARNRFAGVVRSVECDGVMALVELEAGPFLVTAAITRDSVEELGLAAGVSATAVVKATMRDGRARLLGRPAADAAVTDLHRICLGRSVLDDHGGLT
ncbi:MAG: helix-turn-helix transcriptional regulator [Solirubrobacterales bacterium]|nr:helix-turn-helix transcriptional regulator [Solirubrobacterales bacterium]MBV9716428.1 helix-turn-helix transcriptional regulator [Solirubrobacterales bacterium]